MGKSTEIRQLFEGEEKRSWWRDGIFSDEHWAAAPRKVLFLLKEPNSSQHTYASLVEPSDGGSWPADWDGWIEIGRWAYAILHTSRDNIPCFQETDQLVTVPGSVEPVPSWKTARHQVGMMNLKKEPGKASVYDYDLLEKWAMDHAPFLREQFDLIDPEIVVLCGERVMEIAGKTFGFVRTIPLKEPYFPEKGKLWIDFHHYKARYPNFLTFYALVGIMSSALRNPDVLKVLRE